MGKLWEIVQRHIDAQPYGVSQRQLASKLGMSPTALGNWRELKALPAPTNLHALANLTGTPYLRVLDAALEDAGYIPKVGDERGDTPPMKQAAPAAVEPDQDDYVLAAMDDNADDEIEAWQNEP